MKNGATIAEYRTRKKKLCMRLVMFKKAHWLLSPVIRSYGLWAMHALKFCEETEITITKEWFQLKLSGEKKVVLLQL